jgi:hypothetical protein
MNTPSWLRRDAEGGVTGRIYAWLAHGLGTMTS